MTGSRACLSVMRFALRSSGQRIAVSRRGECVSSVKTSFWRATKLLLRGLALRQSERIGTPRRMDCGVLPAKPVFYTDEKMELRQYLSPLPLIAVLRGITPEEVPAVAGV